MFKSLLLSILLFTPTSNNEFTPYRSSNHYNRVIPTAEAKCPEWWDMIQSAGWETKQIKMLDKIMHRESRCNLYAVNRTDPNGGSFGLMQINGFWVDFCKLDKKRDLIDPSINLRCALSIFNYAHNRYGNGWGPWKETE